MVTLTSLKGVGAKTEEKLNALGVACAEDLLFLLPKTYLSLTEFGNAAEAEEGEFVFLSVKVTEKSPLIRKGGKSIAVITGIADGIKLKLVFYNRDYVLKTLRIGLNYRVYGKFSLQKGARLVNPQVEEDISSAKMTGIVPLYPTRGLIAQQTFRNLIGEAMDKTCETAAIPDAETELPLRQAIVFAHRPKDEEEAKRGAERILLEKTIREMLAFRAAKGRAERKQKRLYLCGVEDTERAKLALPYPLNLSQNVAIDTIIKGLRQNLPYNGLLTGDVGSGKTAVACVVCAFTVFSGYQTVFMAPTELVAAQHFAFVKKYFAPIGIRCALLTSSVKGSARTKLLQSLETGEIDFLVGTHSVLGDGVKMPRLGFAVVDEQHRFGVAARGSLFQKAEGLDTLFLSATPIPRTIKLMYLGEHEALTLAPRFERARVKTRIVTRDKRGDMLTYIAGKARTGEKIFLIAPMITDAEGIPTLGAEEVLRDFSARFPDVSAGLLTGKMSFAEKEAAAERFRAGETKVLVATTVVEVGLDVPDASTIAVMHADRMGLASLHQLRGRVGRAGQEAYCFLYTERDVEVPRLKILCETTDGMKIAEEDFRLRGAGEVVGTSQHGKDRVLAGVTEEILLRAKRYADLQLS